MQKIRKTYTYSNDTLAGQFANNLKEILTDKKFKGLIVDNFAVNEKCEGSWEFHYKGMNFKIEWFYNIKNCDTSIEAIFKCYSVDIDYDEIDVTSYEYCLDEIIGEVNGIANDYDAITVEDYLYEMEEMIKSCDIGKTINSICKKVEKLSNEMEEFDENEANRDALINILRYFNLID